MVSFEKFKWIHVVEAPNLLEQLGISEPFGHWQRKRCCGSPPPRKRVRPNSTESHHFTDPVTNLKLLKVTWKKDQDNFFSMWTGNNMSCWKHALQIEWIIRCLWWYKLFLSIPRSSLVIKSRLQPLRSGKSSLNTFFTSQSFLLTESRFLKQ